MSREDVEVVQDAFRAFETGDMEGVLERCHEDIEITQPVELPGVSPRQHGHEGVREAIAIWPEQWDDFRVEVLRTRDLNAHVLVTALTRGCGKESGVEVEMQFTFLFRVRARKIAEWRLFVREQDALEAVGLRE